MNARQKPARECCHNMKHDGMSCEEFDEIRPESVAATINPGDPPAWAVREADRIDRSYTMPPESANAAIARALAAAYARGREDATKGSGEASGIIRHVLNHARRGINIDGTRRKLGDDDACARNWAALLEKCEAILAAERVEKSVEKARAAFYKAARATWDARREAARLSERGCSPKQGDNAWARVGACGDKERAAYDAMLAAEASAAAIRAGGA